MSLTSSQRQSAPLRLRVRFRMSRLLRRLRDRAGSPDVAPEPLLHPEPIIQVCWSRTYGIRGVLASHSWVLYKRRDAPSWERLDAIRAGVAQGLPSLRHNFRPPRFRWGGHRPRVLVELRGPAADLAIDGLERMARGYPHAFRYWGWPGPNCNSFTAALLRAVPSLRAEMPALAIGKDFLPRGGWLARAPSDTGYTLSLYGVLALTVARAEGLEVSVLGLVFGVDPLDLALKLPLLGRVGWR